MGFVGKVLQTEQTLYKLHVKGEWETTTFWYSFELEDIAKQYLPKEW